MLEFAKSRRPLERVLRFRIHRRSENLREDYLKSLVEHALVLRRVPMTVRDVNVTLGETFLIREIPESVLQTYLRKLVNEARVSHEDGTYRLPEERARVLDEEMKRNIQIYERMLERVILLVEQRYGKRVSPEQVDLSKGVVYRFLWELFETSGLTVGRTLYSYRPHECMVPARLIELELAEAFENILKSVTDEPLRDALREAIPAFLREVEPSFHQFLYKTLQNYIYFEVSDLDPEVKSLERACLKGRVGYVDTNFALDLLLQVRERNKIAVETAKLSKELGINLTVTTRTMEELSAHISGSLHRTQKYDVERHLAELARYDDEGLIRSFSDEKQRNPSLTPEGYFFSLEKVFAGKLAELGLEFDKMKHEEVNESPDLENYGRLVADCADLHMIFKNKQMVEHDAFHLLLISEVRKQSKLNLLGPREWFITNDKSLYCVSERLAETGEARFPLSALTELWLHSLFMFLPMTSIDERAAEVGKAFGGFCASRLTASLPEIPFGTLLYIIGPWTKFEIFDLEELVHIAREVYVRRYFMEPQESIEVAARTLMSERIADKFRKMQEETRETVGDKKALSAAKEDLEVRYTKVASELTQLKQSYLTVSSKLAELEKKPGPLHLFLLGCVCMFSIPAVWLTSAFLRIAVPDLLYQLLALLSAAFCISSAIKETRDRIVELLSGGFKPSK